jgi:hypothetical protein
MLDITGMNKAELLAKLYNAAGRSLIISPYPDMTIEEAQKIIADKGLRFDYLKGCILKIDLRNNKLNPAKYNRDNGPGVAEAAIKGEL